MIKRMFQFNANSDIQSIAHTEQVINRLVYHLYGLTYDEVKIVDPETPIIEEEYDA